MPSSRRLWLSVIAVLALAAPSFAQITWNVTYSDAAGTGFNAAGTTGALRRASVDAATTYLNTILDGRGTVRLTWNPSDTGGNSALASFGAGGYAGIDGSFQGGAVYQRARTNTGPFSLSTDGSGKVDFGYNWHYDVAGTTTTLNNSTFDLVSVLTHEIGHSLGLTEFSATNGVGGDGQPLGSPDLYSTMERWFQRGNTPGTGQMFRTDITNPNYGSYNTAIPTNTYTSGNTQGFVGSNYLFSNNATGGLYFGGTFAQEVFGNVIPMYAPTTPAPGSSGSHVNVGPTSGGNGVGQGAIGLMNFSVGQNTIRRFQPYEIAMLMDLGWNVYNWNGTTNGNWSTGTNNLAQSRWTTNSGIVLAANNSTTYNLNSTQTEAPILPVYGQVTANIVLNFRNTGSTAFTSTNDFASAVRLSRLTFASANAGGAITIAGGTLNFGLNADGTPSVLVPKIQQNGLGAVTISSAIQTNTIATQNEVVSGQTVATFIGHNGVTVEGTGSGLVTISGNVTGTGGLTKNSSSFNLVLTGTNSYTGATTVGGGSLFVNGNQSAANGAVTVNSGGTLTGNGTVGGAVTVNSGGFLEGGNGAIGTLAVTNNVTVNGGTLRAQVGASAADQINMSSNAFVLDLKNGSVVALSGSGFTGTTTTYKLADLNGTGNFLRLNGADVGINTDLDVFTSTGGNTGTNSNANLTLALSNFTLTSGDRFTLRRDSTGDFVLVFTPVPEPAGLVLICGLVTAGGLAWRRWAKRG